MTKQIDQKLKLLHRTALTCSVLLAVTGCSGASKNGSDGLVGKEAAGLVVLTPDQVDYIPLNPARGDAAPQAVTLWGNIREDMPSGVLLRFADGFSSPPHIHNITYRGVVIDGGLHNDDPDAAKMWMGPGSFWIQPAGELHITAAEPGGPALSFLEILEGPYLVKPATEAYDNGELPMNVAASNIVWSDFGGSAEISYLWGDPSGDDLAGAMLKLQKGFSGTIQTDRGDLKSVIIAGDIAHEVTGISDQSSLGPGGYFASNAKVPHDVTCVSDAGECILYLRSSGQFSVK